MKRDLTRAIFFLAAAFAVVTMSGLAFAQEESETISDDSRLPVSIDVEPSYIADDPKFLMVVFGEQNEKAIWMALDKSTKDAKHHDTLYVDLNADGDLTDNGERFDLLDEDGKPVRSVKLPDQRISPDSAFTNVAVSIRDLKNHECMIKATWNDEIKFGGGYPELPEKGYMCFGDSTGEAPVVFFNGAKPFEFQTWCPKPLLIGSGGDVRFFMGHRGKRRASFCTTLGHILGKDDYLLATLKYVDKHGVEKEKASKIHRRC